MEIVIKKVIVVGTTASGKSTFAKKLATKLNCPHISLDALFWKPNWQETPDPEFFKKIEEATKIPDWVLDGNYGRTNHLTWPQADTVIWIDMPFWLNLYQSVTRAVGRIISQKELWEGTGNKESIKLLFSKDSIVLWLFKTYNSNVKRYEERMSDSKYNHITFHRLRSRTQMEKFLSNLDS